MRLYGRHIFVAFLLGMFCIQVFLPLAISVSIGVVRMSQLEFIRENFEKRSAFESIEMSAEEYCKQNVAISGEVEIEGMMYDVHSLGEKDGKYLVKVLSDERETGLKKVQAEHGKHDRSKFALVFLSLFIESPFKYSFGQTAAPALHRAAVIQFHAHDVGMIAGPPPDQKA